MKQITFNITGTRALLQHNEVLANPMSPQARAVAAISKKRKKSDEDFEEMAKLEFIAGLYIDKDGPYIPGTAITRALLDSAKKERMGPIFKVFVQPAEAKFKLMYDGPRTAEALWKAGFYDQRMVKVQSSKTLRTRPCFPEGWAAAIGIIYDDAEVDASAIERCFRRAADYGIGDYRPLFGRFKVE